MRKRSRLVLAATALSALAATIVGISLSRPAVAATTTLAPVADAYVAANHASKNYGSSSEISVDNSPVKHVYMKFTVSGLTGTVASATLRLTTADVSGSQSNSGGTVSEVSDSSWTESGITFNNAPAIDGPALASLPSVSRNQSYDVDVTSAVTGNGTITLAITTTSSDGADYDSREAGSDGPQLIITTSTDTSPSPTTSQTQGSSVPRPDHVVIVVLENKNYTSIVGSSSAPYLNSLASQGALFTNSFAIGHPSQPNYIALFSGSTQGVTNDNCPQNFTGQGNLGAQLISAGFTFTGYSESMPSDGYTGCTSGTYARKHNPWVDFDNVPAASNLTYTHFPTDYSQLPSVSFVIPNLCDDMHDCSISTGDTWMQNNLDGYAQWAKTHNSLLIVTFDEASSTSPNQVYTVFVGQHVKPGSYSEQITHYSVLRTLEDAYGLTALNNAASATAITDIWQ